MFPSIKIFGLNFYMYGLMISIGIISAVLLLMKRSKRAGYNDDHIFDMSIIAIICGVIGAKLFFIITDIPELSKDPSSIIKDFGNGFVFYGAIFGGIAAAYVYSRHRKWDFLEIFDLAIPSVPLAQAFGRIGCFMAGCCYGKETESFFYVKFTNSNYAPNGVHLIPTQLVSSLGNFVIFGILLLLDRKQNKRNGQLSAAYLIIYSIARFIIEYFRGDPRGTVFNIFSTAQFTCIFVFIAGIILYWKAPQKTEKTLDDEKADGTL